MRGPCRHHPQRTPAREGAPAPGERDSVSSSIPDELDAARAATITQSHCTALFALRDRGSLRPDETVLVLGAGGGVGPAAIQMAAALGATTMAVASTPEKRDAALKAGAATW